MSGGSYRTVCQEFETADCLALQLVRIRHRHTGAMLNNPKNEEPTSRQCLPGSIPSHLIDVQIPEDIAAAFAFSKKTTVPIVMNTGVGAFCCGRLIFEKGYPARL